ncbi:exopolysaccharide biosynthesis protein [Marivita sp. S0852]|uniref:exopolysaccharide biosynthesis protein n=1 Tax=Marivita sp. S0852 TaxID=3373893 RepID=UPI003982A73D
MTDDPHAPRSLTDLLDVLDPQDAATGLGQAPPVQDARLNFQEMLDRVGPRSFGAVLLVPSLILVSPLSAIPLMPTLGGLLILTIATQAFFGRRHIWLPAFLAHRTFSARQRTRAVSYLRRPAAWLDRHSRNRLSLLTAPPLDRVALLSVMAVATTWPFLEILPMFTSVSAGGVALVAFALMVRDGFVLIAGYAVIAGTLLFVIRLVTGFI